MMALLVFLKNTKLPDLVFFENLKTPKTPNQSGRLAVGRCIWNATTNSSLHMECNDQYSPIYRCTVSFFDAFRRKHTLSVDFNKKRCKSTYFAKIDEKRVFSTKGVNFRRFLLKSTKIVYFRRKASKPLTILSNPGSC